MLDNVVLLHSHSSDHLSFHQRQLVALIDCTVKLFCQNVHEFDLIFYLANKAMPCGQAKEYTWRARDHFHEINSFV